MGLAVNKFHQAYRLQGVRRLIRDFGEQQMSSSSPPSAVQQEGMCFSKLRATCVKYLSCIFGQSTLCEELSLLLVTGSYTKKWTIGYQTLLKYSVQFKKQFLSFSNENSKKQLILRKVSGKTVTLWSKSLAKAWLIIKK